MSTVTTKKDTLVGPPMSHRSVPHQVNRLIFDVGQPYEKFLGRFEAGDRTRFAVDQPSTVFASFADPAMTRLGLSLDGQLAELLEAVGVQASPLLLSAGKSAIDVDSLAGDVVAGR